VGLVAIFTEEGTWPPLLLHITASGSMDINEFVRAILELTVALGFYTHTTHTQFIPQIAYHIYLICGAYSNSSLVHY